MNTTIVSVLEMFQRIGLDNISSMSLDNNKETIHAINHRYRDVVIVPFVGVESNIDFVMSKGKKTIICADGIRANVVDWKEYHVCELEKDIQELYKIDAWSFIKRWWNTEKRMDSMTFIKMKLEKI